MSLFNDKQAEAAAKLKASFNPYFNGCLSLTRTGKRNRDNKTKDVSILILMDVSL